MVTAPAEKDRPAKYDRATAVDSPESALIGVINSLCQVEAFAITSSPQWRLPINTRLEKANVSHSSCTPSLIADLHDPISRCLATTRKITL
jgi:hypothetical protein